TTELVEEATRLTNIEQEIESCHRELVYLDSVIGTGLLGASDAPLSAFHAEGSIREATAAMMQAKEQCEFLHNGASSAAAQYEWTERCVSGLQQQLSASLAYTVGAISPFLIAMILPGVLVTSAGLAAYLATLSEQERAKLFTEVRFWLKDNSTVLTDPRVVTA